MHLRIIEPSIPSQRFDCQGCTRCCRDLVVQLTPEDRERIDRAGWRDRLGTEPYVRLGRAHVLDHRPAGGCVFLTAGGRCRIHVEHGAAAKPFACRLYPFTFSPEGGALRVGYRFDCPSIARNAGGPLPKHRRELRQLAEAGQGLPLPSQPHGHRVAWELVKGHPLEETTVDRLVGVLDRWLGQREPPLVVRLLGLYALVQTLASAKLARFDDERLLELVSLLSPALADTAGELAGKALDPPTRRQWKLLSQAIFAHCEHIPFAQARAPLRRALAYRWNQVGRARRLAAGRGAIPPLGALPAAGSFERLRTLGPGADLPRRDCEDLITRYLRARITCRTAFGPAYYGWPLLDGLRALLLSMAIAGWLARAVAMAGGRDAFGYEDLVAAVGIIDRTAGRAPELGARSARLRLRYLAEDDGLLRLLRTWPILP